ncbi:MAG: Mrp/NBP35 family ATP-binding protein [Firmicutes bacterium]|nr:Mrp/NBP35 family ATP-binding protein [Bacillota bacterium]
MELFANKKQFKRVVYVYSGKGGVGKSTICLNLAFALSNFGYKVGVFDGDLSTPSMPNLVKGLDFTKPIMKGVIVLPSRYKNIALTSSGLLGIPSDGTFLSGQYLKGALYQLLFGVKWDIDILLIDMPPGTTDLHKELFFSLKGEVLLVTTPHSTSYEDVIRGIALIERFNIPILGIVENMSYVKCDNCHHNIVLFPENSKKVLCEKIGIKYLLSFPFDSQVSKMASRGLPYMNEPNLESSTASKYLDLLNIIISSGGDRNVPVSE